MKLHFDEDGGMHVHTHKHEITLGPGWLLFGAVSVFGLAGLVARLL
jgi:hypothetical protein